MRPHFGKNVVIALALVSAGFLAAWLRFRPHLENEGRWTDGVGAIELASREELRFAVWGDAESFGTQVNGALDELGGTLSDDGRFLVFASGERGLGADLYLASMEAGAVADVRPIEGLDTAADECAPAFAGGWLYFASDRSGGEGGLDLYRASFRDGLLGPPEHLGSELASEADDTDPAPLPGGDALVFASDRAGAPTADHDLYFAHEVVADVGVELAWSVTRLGELSTPFDERDPSFAADGRLLYFASDRDGSRGGYDLYRSVRTIAAGPERFLVPERLAGMTSERSERAPRPSADGFTLVFASETDAGDYDLARAHTLEIFRARGRPVGWIELVLFATLLLVALLAWLAKRWEQLEVLYKCLLVSVVAHGMLLWWSRDVYPEGGSYELSGSGRRIRLHLASDPLAEAARNAERSGALAEEGATSREEVAAPERIAGAAAGWLLTSEVATAPELTAPEAAEALAPGREEAVQERSVADAEPSIPLQASDESFERMSLAVRAPTLEAARGAPRAEREPGAEPARASAAPAETSTSRPGRFAAELTAEGGELGSAPSRAESRRARTEAGAVDLAVAQPAEHTERLLAAAPGPAELAPARLDGPARSGEPRPARAERSAFDAPTDSSTSESPSVRAPLAALPAERTPSPSNPERAGHGREPLADARPDVDLAGPAEEASVARVDAPAAGADEALANATRFSPEHRASPDHADGALALERFARPAGEVGVSQPRPAERELAAPSQSASPDSDPRRAEAARERAHEGPVAVDVARAPREEAAAIGEPARAEEGPALEARALVPGANFEPVRVGIPEPRRFAASSEATAVEAPGARELLVAAAARDEDRVPDRALDATPYRSRVGAEKLVALQKYGGSEETEEAVAAGLRYLASIQADQGFWGSATDRHEKYGHVAVGKTGLALLAFLGAGHMPGSSTEHSAVTTRAIDFLLAVQDGESGHFGYSCSYSHGIATYALAECYALTHEERLREPIERAVAQIVRHQEENPEERFSGGWGYYYPDDRTFDRWPRVSITAWQVMALESAQLGGLTVDGAVFERAKAFLVNAWDERRGAYRYSHDPSRLNSAYDVLPGSTPAAIFALSLLGEDVASDEFESARRFVLTRAPAGYRFTGDDDFVLRATGNLYFWYYGTLAMFRVGGEPWVRWNVAMKETLLPSQEPDGSWRPICVYATYAGDDDDDRSYTTALNVLSLEVYYRYFTPLLRVK